MTTRFSNLSKNEKTYAKTLVLGNPELREILKTREYQVTMTFPYDNTVVEKTVLLPARFTWDDTIQEGGTITFKPLPSEEETTSDSSSKTSTKKKTDDEEETKNSFAKDMNSVGSIFKRWFFGALFGLLATVLLGFAFGIIPMNNANKMDVSQKVHSSNMGFIDTNMDGIPDENAADIAAQDSYYNSMMKYNEYSQNSLFSSLLEE